MRTMFDSTTAGDIPETATLVAGYVDGTWPWSPADWALFPAATLVRIAVWASTGDGQVLDVETGNATPEQAPGWVQRRREAGVDPTVYCNESTWPAVRAAFTAQGVREPHWWIAHYESAAVIPAGAVALQYADEAQTGAHYDLSVVADYWPGVDPAPGPLSEDSDVLLLDHGDETMWFLSPAGYISLGGKGPDGRNHDADSLYAAGVKTAAISPDVHAALLAAK
jgi:hypothetical protein